MNFHRPRQSFLKAICTALLVLWASTAAVACGSADTSATSSDASVSSGDTGIRLVSAIEGADVAADPPQDLVILDVRTPDEFNAGHIEGAIMIDFYEDDFATKLAELDPSVPYLLYCRSGNRSGQTATLLDGLGFTDVADVDGGINAWNAAGLPTVTP